MGGDAPRGAEAKQKASSRRRRRRLRPHDGYHLRVRHHLGRVKIGKDFIEQMRKIGKTKRSFESLTEDLILIKEAGINTLRVYEPIDDIDVLDELQAAGVKVVISFGYNQKGRFDIVSGTFIDYVKKYKNHENL